MGPALPPAPFGAEGLDMKTRRSRAILAAIVLLITALPAASQVELRFWPADQQVATGEDGSLAVMLDDAIEVRTIELWVTYEESTVMSEGGEPGELFCASGCPLFPVFEEDLPGSWYAGSVTLGPSCYLTGPGELYRWDFKGLASGICRVEVDSVVLYDPAAQVIEGVTGLRLLEIEYYTSLVPVDRVVGSPGLLIYVERDDAETALFDLYHLGAEVAEEHGAEGARPHAGEVEDFHPGQRWRHE